MQDTRRHDFMGLAVARAIFAEGAARPVLAHSIEQRFEIIVQRLDLSTVGNLGEPRAMSSEE